MNKLYMGTLGIQTCECSPPNLDIPPKSILGNVINDTHDASKGCGLRTGRTMGKGVILSLRERT